MQPMPHQLYLGTTRCSACPAVPRSSSRSIWRRLTRRARRRASARLGVSERRRLAAAATGDDQTARLTQDGRVVLWLDCGPDAKQDLVGGIRATGSARPSARASRPARSGRCPAATRSRGARARRSRSAALVTVDGTTSAHIVAVTLSTITLDRSLSGAMSGAALIDAGTSSFVGRIVRSAGQSLVLAGVDPGRSITVDGTSTATVLDASGAFAMLDQLIAGSAVVQGAILLDAGSSEPVGTLAHIDADFSVPLDSGAEFLVGDTVTVDGSTQAAVKAAQARGVTLQAPIQNATQGNRLVLANALPVLRPEGADASGVLPSLDTIFARVGFTKSGLAPDAAYCDTAPLDTSNAFYPFGKQPQKFTTFYLASEEVFQRQNAQVTITFLLAQAGVGYDDGGTTKGVGPTALDVGIEYFNGDAWTAMGPAQSLLDQTQSLTVGDRTHPTTISFICPANWQATKVSGQSKHWLRMRIDGGNYGHPLQLSVDTRAASRSWSAIHRRCSRPSSPRSACSTPSSPMPAWCSTASPTTTSSSPTTPRTCSGRAGRFSLSRPWATRSRRSISASPSNCRPDSSACISPPVRGATSDADEFALRVGVRLGARLGRAFHAGRHRRLQRQRARAVHRAAGRECDRRPRRLALLDARAAEARIPPTPLPGLGLWINAVEAHQGRERAERHAGQQRRQSRADLRLRPAARAGASGRDHPGARMDRPRRRLADRGAGRAAGRSAIRPRPDRRQDRDRGVGDAGTCVPYFYSSGSTTGATCWNARPGCSNSRRRPTA